MHVKAISKRLANQTTVLVSLELVIRNVSDFVPDPKSGVTLNA